MEGGNSNTTAQKGGCVLFNWTNLITILSHYLSARLLESEGISLELDIFSLYLLYHQFITINTHSNPTFFLLLSFFLMNFCCFLFQLGNAKHQLCCHARELNSSAMKIIAHIHPPWGRTLNWTQCIKPNT